MIRRIISVKNVGTFRNSTGPGNTEFRRLTVIHAENGRGKTTLCAILRSLQSGNPTLILERKTLDSPDPPHVKILINDADIHEFKDGKWAAPHPTMEIFDAGFIADNVYSGDEITHDHKKNLCRVVLGREGVKLASAFDDQDSAVRAASSTLATTKDAVQELVPRGQTLDGFIGLAADEDIDKRITDKKAEVTVLTDAAAIRARLALGLVNLPQLPANVTATLGKTIDGVSADAENLIKAHIERHKMAKSGEAWLSEGLGYVAEDECPFCAQSLQNSPSIGSLRNYFIQTYNDFKNHLANFKRAVDHPLSADSLLAVQRTIESNAKHAEFWTKYVPLEVPVISFDERIEPVIHGLRDALAPLVAKKLASPLERVEHSPESLAAIEDWKKLGVEVATYNAAVTSYNEVIEKIKAGLGAKNLPQLQRELAALESQKLRHATATIITLKAYSDARAAKTDAETAKEKARELLDAYNAKRMDKYHKAVNHILARFGAQFKLSKVEVEYIGRTPRLAFAFIMRGKRIDPGGATTPVGEPCFRNTLSSGDRSTLALAFFIAQLKNRADLADLVIIFDDPFTSLHSFRQTWTCATIRKLASSAKQVVVLSHSLDFLRLVAKRPEAGTLSTLKIDLHNTIDSRIIELDLEDATASVVDKDIIKLRSFVMGDDNDSNGAVRSIRPLLENHIRKMAPDSVPNGNGWLGTFLGDIKKADEASPLAQFKPIYDDLDNLNEYASPYAHDSGVASPINEAELHTNATVALKIIGRE